jgi:3-phenylpropionate/trans-cinnamate dioxygenase ferredoxin component
MKCKRKKFQEAAMGSNWTQQDKTSRGAADAGAYFRYMTQFVGFTPEDARAIRSSALIIEKHIPQIVADFYTNLLRYPPTRQPFLRTDGTLDQDYLQKRMQHLSNFWRRTASGEYDDDYARYVDYVGRAHTSHGADPAIYIEERYVIGQVGFIQHAIHQALFNELHEYDPRLEAAASQAWNKLMMVLLEMLARAYEAEHAASVQGDPLVVDDRVMQEMAVEAYETGLGLIPPRNFEEVLVAVEGEIPDGERKLVEANGISIGIFHHRGAWYALRNHCLHRGGPVATGALEGDELVCPWHGYRYDVTNGCLLADPTARLEMYLVSLREGKVYLSLPASTEKQSRPSPIGESSPAPAPAARPLAPGEFRADDLPPGKIKKLVLEGEVVAVYNIAGQFYATQENCTHRGGPLSMGDLQEHVVQCPYHGAQFNVRDGTVVRGPAQDPLKTYRVTVLGEIGRVESS